MVLTAFARRWALSFANGSGGLAKNENSPVFIMPSLPECLAGPTATNSPMLFPLAGGSGTVIKLGDLLMILDLHRQGLSVSAIARHLCIDRKTVRSAIAKGLEPPKYKTRPPRARITDPFEPYLV